MVILVLGGAASAGTCDGVKDRKTCLLAKKAELKKELSEVERELRQLSPVRRPGLKLTKDFWLTLDVGMGLAKGFYPSVGISVPVGPVYVSPGVWFGSSYTDLDEPSWGWYLSVGYSWTLLD